MKKLLLILFFIGLISSVSFGEENPIHKTRLPETINKFQPSINPVLTIDGNSLFLDRKIHPENNASIRDKDDIWISSRVNGSWTEPNNISKPLNTPESDVMFSISPDQSRYLVYGIYDSKIGLKKPGFSITKKTGGKWEEPRALKIRNFYNDSSNFYGNLSADGKVLLMALHRKDSRGDLDLYVSFRIDSNLNYSEPINLGDVINTSENEGSPFLAYDGKTLYFSSNGHKGFGRQDLFMSRRLDDTWKNWSTPVNLGKEINSPMNETGIYLSALADTAYFVSWDTLSQREGVYFSCLPDSLRPFPYAVLRGKIFAAKKENSGLMTDEVHFSMNNDINSETEIFISNPETGRFYYILSPGRQFNIFGSVKGFEDVSFSVGTRYLSSIRFIDNDFIMNEKKESELIETVYYETNIAELTPENQAKLALISNKVFAINEAKLKIVGHTDEVGSDSENYTLSYNRALNAAKFLDGLGFNLKNIKIEGKGKSEPVSDKKDLNRRVEVFWIE